MEQMPFDEIDAFAAEARRFREWVLREIEPTSRGARGALVRITRLYLAALSLPAAWSDELENQPDARGLADEEVRRATAACARLPLDYYGVVSDPLPTPPENPGIGSLVDDIADIYRDVVGGLVEYEDGRRARAVWEWRFNFDHHWGEHAVNAIRVLHCWLVQHEPDS